MASLAENLKPPFYAAIINEEIHTRTLEDERTPIDEMVSIAPNQPGFLGLETSRDQNGKGMTISYWTDLQSEKAWEHKGDNEIRSQFDGRTLYDTCAIQVSKIEQKIRSRTPIKAGPRVITKNTMIASFGAIVLNAFPAIAGLFGHEAIQ